MKLEEVEITRKVHKVYTISGCKVSTHARKNPCNKKPFKVKVVFTRDLLSAHFFELQGCLSPEKSLDRLHCRLHVICRCPLKIGGFRKKSKKFLIGWQSKLKNMGLKVNTAQTETVVCEDRDVRKAINRNSLLENSGFYCMQTCPQKM